MIKELFIVFLILSLVFTSACVQQETPTGTALEEQAVEEIEHEMEQAIEDVTMEDIENALLE